MTNWGAISFIAAALAVGALILASRMEKKREFASGTLAQKAQYLFWFYAISFMVTAITWGMIDAFWNGYGIGVDY